MRCESYRLAQIALSLSLLWAGSVVAQSAENTNTDTISHWQKPDWLTASIRDALWSSNRQLDDQTWIHQPAIWLKAKGKINQNFSGLVSAFKVDESHAPDYAMQSRINEAYLTFKHEDTQIRLGRQIFSWGRADRINPSDFLGAKNLTQLVTDDEQQRLGVDAIKLTQSFSNISVNLVHAFRFTPTRSLLPPAVNRQAVDVQTEKASQQALRLDWNHEGLDGSLTYFDGLEKNPYLALDPARGSVVRTYSRIRALAADFATSINKVGLRGEVAMIRHRAPALADAYFTRGSTLYSVLGVERELPDWCNLNLQYIYRLERPRQSPASAPLPVLGELALVQGLVDFAPDHVNHALSLRLAKNFLNDRMQTELVLLHNLRRHDYAVRPRLVFDWTDNTKLSIGADLFRGKTDSVFGSIRNNSVFFVELGYTI